MVNDEEPLHRRIHPNFRKPDGTISSQAFRDDQLSVDRGHYRTAEDSLLNYSSFGLAALVTSSARSLEQEVVSDPDLLNPAHALVKGHKTKAVAKALARASNWIVPIP
jgi:hypothetical protein